MQAIAVNTEMPYRVVSVKDTDDQESTFVYAVDREEALQQVTGLFSSQPTLVGELEGMHLITRRYRLFD